MSILPAEKVGQRIQDVTGTSDVASDADKALLTMVRERRSAAKQDRKRYEPTWHLCQSFLAGRQWVGWNPRTRRIVELDNKQDRERHTVNVCTQYHQTVLGKLYVEDLRPDLLFRREDIESESVADHSQKVGKFVWDSEVNADRRLYLVLHKQLTYGTSAARCLYDPTQGDPIGDFPVGPDGKPMVDIQEAVQYVAQQQQQGQSAQFKSVKSGKIVWEPLSPFNILTPPGVEDPDFFPWFFVERPVSIQAAKVRYPKARNLKPQSLSVADARDIAIESPDGAPTGSGQLKDHVLIATMYEMPSVEYPSGRTITYAENQILERTDTLPYKLRGMPHSGVVFFRYHLVDGRFWGKGILEDLIGPQRQLNRARSQMIEMKDRNLGRVYARKGTLTANNMPTGKIMELIEIPLHSDFPQETFGTQLGPWIENEARLNLEDMDRVAGLSDFATNGTPPAGITAYSALALSAEQDDRRVGPVLKDVRNNVGDLMLLSLELVKQYWQDNKQLAIAGSDGTIDEFIFQKALLPLNYYINVTRNAPLPTTPAAEAQKIFDLWNAAIAGGQPLPIDWLKNSVDAGRPLPIPKREDQVQRRKAEMEHYFIHAGQMIIPDPFDDDMLHLQIHRAERFNQMGVPGTEQYVEMLLQHEQMHVQDLAKKQPSMGAGGGAQVPALQGGHGIEAQNGDQTNQQGLAQQKAGDAPLRQPTGPAQ